RHVPRRSLLQPLRRPSRPRLRRRPPPHRPALLHELRVPPLPPRPKILTRSGTAIPGRARGTSTSNVARRLGPTSNLSCQKLLLHFRQQILIVVDGHPVNLER